MIALLLFGVLVITVLVILRKLRNSGYWDSTIVEIHEKPELLCKSLEIFYKHHVGGYSQCATHAKEVKSLVPEDAKIIAIYYDNPKETRDELCQSALGVVYSIDKRPLFDENFATNLTRWGFERMTVPAVERSVVCKQKFNGFFSYLHLVNHTYPAVNNFIDEQRVRCRLTVEIVANDELVVFCPLDHVDEFIVPEVIPTDELELKISSIRNSDSETDVSDEEEMSSIGGDVDDETSQDVEA